MSNARLAGLLGAIAACTGGAGAWASPPPTLTDLAVASPAITARPNSLHDIDPALLRRAEARPAAAGLAVPLADSAGRSDSAAVLASRGADVGGLPSPASWLLLVIGVGMIGGALRGFIVANRALARLQPEEFEQPSGRSPSLREKNAPQAQ